MRLPKISVITVTYNDAAGLRRTLENLARVDYPTLEIVVVDGASTDGTRQVIDRFAHRIDRWVSEPDRGIYDAMNKGMALASGDYFWFVNAGDTLFDPAEVLEIFGREDIRGDVYYGETVVIAPSGKILGLRRKKLPEHMTWRDLRRGMVVCHQSVIVARGVAPAYDLRYRYAADVAWVLESLKRARTVVNTGLVLSVFETGGTSTRHRRESLAERFSIMREYFGLASTVWAHIGFAFDVFNPACRKFTGTIPASSSE
ncbi:MAG: glycosyltransferase [Rikenellaceae bacterium]|jgi:glycosyltransferase involved in cell wall biosynthesis|nr:glycosyltransferase [Rikenellaceae bacterium]